MRKRGKYFKSVVLGLLAFVLYGGWALYSNLEYGGWIASVAGITQGGMSFLITTLLSSLMMYLFEKGRTVVEKFLYAVIGTNVITLPGMCLAHYMVGTPNIVQTILPSAIIGFFFTLFYTTARLKAPLFRNIL